MRINSRYSLAEVLAINESESLKIAAVNPVKNDRRRLMPVILIVIRRPLRRGPKTKISSSYENI